MNKVMYKSQECVAKRRVYNNGNLAIQLHDGQTGEPIATATVNLEDGLPSNLAYIKDYSENKGIFDALHDAGFIKRVITVSRSAGFIAPLVEIDMSKFL